MNKLRSSGLLAPLYPPSLSPIAVAVVVVCVLLLRPAAVAEPPRPEKIEISRHERVIELPKSAPPVTGKAQAERRPVSASKSAPKTHARLR